MSENLTYGASPDWDSNREERAMDQAKAGTAMQSGRSLDVRIQQALDLIHHGHDPHLGVPELARRAGISESHFYRLFRHETGVTPAKYLNELRIRQVEHLVRTTALPLKDIFAIVGVTDRSHFLRKFKELYGLPPSIYRTQKGVLGQKSS